MSRSWAEVWRSYSAMARPRTVQSARMETIRVLAQTAYGPSDERAIREGLQRWRRRQGRDEFLWRGRWRRTDARL